MRVRNHMKAWVVCGLAVGLAAAGCTKNTGGPGTDNGPSTAHQAIVIDIKGSAPTPAPPIPNAKPGGTIYWLEDGAPEHLDPQEIYVADSLTIETLLYRHLTNYIEDPGGGSLQLVGDLATNAGESSNDGKTWTYHLRDGLKFEDGSPITSKDIAYGIARSFGTRGQQGPQYLQNALNPKRDWTPDKGDVPPGVTLPNDKTIVFNFDSPHAEMPYLGAEPTSAPVPKAKDTGTRYEAEFVSSGPYMRDGTYDQTTKLTLKRNPNWDPKTDPIRHQYADKFVFDLNGGNRDTMTQRLIADQGDDQTALSTYVVAQANIAQVQGDQNLMKRTGAGPTPFVSYVDINTSRVTDVKVRQALNWAFDRGAFVIAVGGSAVAGPATWIMSPVVPGWKDYDAYKSADGHGDVDKAKALLAGATPKLTYCFANTQTQQKYAVVLQNALQRAGFQITLNTIDRDSYYTTIGDKTTTCDLIYTGWGQDYPDPEATIDVLLNGSGIAPRGNVNTSYFNEPTINKKLDDLKVELDRAKAATAYGELDQEIMTNYAPKIPLYYAKAFNMRGSKVWSFISPLYSNYNLVDAFVTG
jgi:peptide/nickel transport system substrate-binding protein